MSYQLLTGLKKQRCSRKHGTKNMDEKYLKKRGPMIISVASGKGGTGKTMISTSLALSCERAQLADCDVEEPNAHIFLKPEIKGKEQVFIPVPEVDETRCSTCGRCCEVCVYNAIVVVKKSVLVFPELCHGCGACSYFCPEGAIKEVSKEIGFVENGSSGELDFVHGKLNIGETMAPPLIKAVKKHIASEKTVIIDAPPGTSCPVITTIKDTDFVLLVTEPTPFGLNDLTLAVEVVRKLDIPFGVVINRSDLGNEKTFEYCSSEQIPVLMMIPFMKEIASAYSKGVPVVQAFPEYREPFRKLFGTIKGTIEKKKS
jgi:MinD superfamily P-loop ATPase